MLLDLTKQGLGGKKLSGLPVGFSVERFAVCAMDPNDAKKGMGVRCRSAEGKDAVISFEAFAVEQLNDPRNPVLRDGTKWLRAHKFM